MGGTGRDDGHGWIGGAGVWSRRAFVRGGLGLLAPSWLSGCMPSPTEPTGDRPPSYRLTVQPSEPSASPVVGESWLDLNPTGRDAILYVPESVDPTVAAPLLVTLHGFGGGAIDWRGFYPACDARGMIMLAVESRGVTWDRVSGYFGPDVGFIDRAIGYTFERCAVDPARIGLAGFSDGASYALSLGVSNGDLFTHLVGFSPGFWSPPVQRVGWPGIWISHGRDDEVLSESRTQSVIVAELLDTGYTVEYLAFDGGHEVPQEVGSAALDWFLPTGP